MTIEEMRKKKRELGYTNQMIAERTGIPLSTVQKIFAGATASPRRDTIAALEKLLAPGTGEYGEFRPDTPSVRESVPAYSGKPFRPGVDGTQALQSGTGPHTLKDYLELPEDQRVELIDGVFYDMAAPTTIHQSIAGFLHKKLLDHVLEHKGPCYPFISPVDVQLDCDDKTVIQPDVLVVCDRSKYRNGRVFGAPDLVVEAGVREYWIIDPEKKLLVQYDMEHLELPVVYNADMEIPVLIWDGTCRIDLKEMYEAISFLWETD